MGPIESLISANPVSVTIATRAQPAYDPSQVYDPGAAAPAPAVTGAIVKATEEGLALQATATLYLLADDFDGDPEVTQVEVDGATYAVAAVRKRRLDGAHNGWTLHLRR